MSNGTTMSDLHAAILDSLKNNGLDVREIGAKDLIDGTINLTRPAVNITINQGNFSKVTLYTYKCRAYVSLIVVINRLRGGPTGEFQRKEAVYNLIESICNFITLQNFGLPLENPMIPDGFRNITTAVFAKAGYQLYELKFWTSWTVDMQDKDDLGTIQSILAKYWLVPNDDPATDPDRAEDKIDLT